MEYTKESIIQYFKSKYRAISDLDFEIMYDCAYDIMRSLRYPYNNEITEIPDDYMKSHRTWIFRAIQEHLDKEGIPMNVTSYYENGVSITFDKTGLSKDLISEIMPLAKRGIF